MTHPTAPAGHGGANLHIEPLEDRCCRSGFASDVAGLPHEEAEAPSPIPLGQNFGPGAISAGNLADFAFVRSQLGLSGWGQTVAVIDSGIAYDHAALGGGLGRSFRVVGGWDFAENDAQPYDDGPAGFHGTHVAGVLGSSDANYPGVAPQVDLVALRVFDDEGHTSFSHIERALQWVIQHRNDFRFPITTVNISIGSAWNRADVPAWATLEDELSTLARHGVFVAVAAGNDFARDPRVGLSYPAASPHVLPVGSVDATGQLSAFSQRHPRMLAASGESLVSTGPDHLYGFNGVTDDFVRMHGTSVSTPIVAGAHVLLQEAANRLGLSPLNPRAAQEIFVQNADPTFDAITGQTYRRLNLRRALTSLLPPDESTNRAQSAFMGSVGDGLEYSGVMQRGDDTDYVAFRADRTERVRVSLEWHGPQDQRPTWIAPSAQTESTWEWSLQAGQQYTVGLAAHGGIGRYSIRITPTSPTLSQAYAPLAPFGETRVEWVAPSGGLHTLVAAIDAPTAVDFVSVSSRPTGMLLRIDQPLSSETMTINAHAGRRYEFAVQGQRARMTVDVMNSLRSGGSSTEPSSRRPSAQTHGIDWAWPSVANCERGASAWLVSREPIENRSSATIQAQSVAAVVSDARLACLHQVEEFTTPIARQRLESTPSADHETTPFDFAEVECTSLLDAEWDMLGA